MKKYYDKVFEFRSRGALKRLNASSNAALIRAGKEGKPLPKAIFGNIHPDRIVQVVPQNGGGRFLKEDKDAARGVAGRLIDDPKPILPFYFNVYDYANK